MVTNSAAAMPVLLVDCQRDFLGVDGARISVGAEGAAKVIDTADVILEQRVFEFAIPLMMVSHFPACARIANLFRHGAAVSGSPGAEIYRSVRNFGRAKAIAKSRSSAFSNAALDAFPRQMGAKELYVMGVFAEGRVPASWTHCESVTRST